MSATTDLRLVEKPPSYAESLTGTTNLAFDAEKGENSVNEKQDGAVVVKTYDNPDDDPDFDPWKLPAVVEPITPWSELTPCGKFKRLTWDYVGRIISLIALMYLFICSLDFLSSAFQLLGGKQAGAVFRDSELFSNPVAGLMIGVLATVLVQSSSTSTSIVVSMVGAGILDVRPSIPIVMGANIGTSVTNTIVSLGQITNKNDFRRAFAGATVHDMFNWLAVIVLLPIEVATGYLYHLSGAIVSSLHLETNKDAKKDLLKVVTKPFTALIIQINKNVIKDVAHGDDDAFEESMIKHCCDKKDVNVSSIEEIMNGFKNQTANVTKWNIECQKSCSFLFKGLAESVSDATIGAILLVIALALLCICLVFIVKILHALLRGKIAMAIKKFVNSDFPGKLAYFTGYLAILVGCGLTILVQSSSIFTSSLTPLVGMGVISLDRMYPLTLGSNIGTTTTAILAALAQSIDDMPNSLQIAFCHLFFNLSGILLFYPIPILRVPIRLAKFLGNETAKYRWFAIAYLLCMFFLFPAAVFALSVAGWYYLLAVFAPIVLIIIVVLFIKAFQSKCPARLPSKLQNWKFLPVCMRSLKPVDRIFGKVTHLCKCLRHEHHADTTLELVPPANKTQPSVFTRL